MDAVSGFKPSFVLSELSGTHKSWHKDTETCAALFHRLLAWSKVHSGHVLSLHGSRARGCEKDLGSTAWANLG